MLLGWAVVRAVIAALSSAVTVRDVGRIALPGLVVRAARPA